MADVNDITQGTLVGTGYFDKFMAAFNVHIDNQYTSGRIQGPDYATVYLGALQTALSQAVLYANTVAQIGLLEQKTKTELAQINDKVDLDEVTGAIGKQKALQQAQADGFLRDAEQKAVKIIMDAWQVSKSVSGDAIDVPDGARNDDIEDMIIKLRQGVAITESIYKFNCDAGPDQTAVPVSSVVLLDGTASTSPIDATPAETIATYQWTQINGAAVVLTDATTATPFFTANALAQTYEFKLTISGSLGSSDFDTVSITTV